MSAACADLNPSPYDAFAPYYDAFSATSDYEAWTESILEVARRHGLAGTAVLDVACGTGNSFVPFLRRGFRVTGCDSSAAMLAQAASKAEEARLELCDMRELPVLGRFDLVTCFDDSLNYLADEDELTAALAGIAGNLSPAGLACFDLNSLLAYRTTFATDSVREHDGLVFAWRGAGAADAGPGCAADAQIDAFVPRRNGMYRRVATRHRQRHFARETVVGLLGRAGLECLAVHGVRSDASLDERPDELRHLKLLYTARRAEGGDR